MQRRRKPSRLNGLSVATLSSSASSTLLSAGVRPRVSRKGRDDLSPHSTPSRRAESALASSPGSRLHSDSEDDGVLPVLRETAAVIIRRLHQLGRSAAKGKVPERPGPDEAWDCMSRLTDMFKKSRALLRHVEINEALHATLAFISDPATVRQRTAAYRLLRHMLSRRNWGRMIHIGVECVIIR